MEEKRRKERIRTFDLDTLSRIRSQKLINEVISIVRQFIRDIRPNKVATDDILENLLDGFSIEGRESQQELIQNDTKGPPVHFLSVTLTKDDFRGKVVGRAHFAGQSLFRLRIDKIWRLKE